MKLSFRKKTVLITSTVLLAISGSVFAACLPNNCAELRDQCIESGGTGCDYKYARCLRSFGCPVP